MVSVKISLVDIFTYIGDRNRPMVEGEQVFKAGHVILCQVKCVEKLEIFGLVLQTSALTSKPHEVNLCLTNPVNNWKCVCSCKAGQSGFCKHVVAVLISINRHELLEEFSCTAYTQAWGKEKESIKTLYGAEPTTSFYHPEKFKTERNVVFAYQASEALKRKNFEHFINCNESSALHVFVQRSKTSSETNKIREDVVTLKSRKLDTLDNLDCNINVSIKAILENAQHSVLENLKLQVSTENDCCTKILENLKSDDVQNAATMNQSNTEWHNLRKLRITGSRIYSVYTYSKEKWSEKAVNYFWPKGFTRKFTEYGKHYEQHALNAYEQNYTFYHVQKVGLAISKRYPWFAYSPDGVVMENGEPTKLLEIKCPYSGKENDAEKTLEGCVYLEKKGNTWFLKKKHPYYGQVQFGMALLNLKNTDFIIYSSASNSICKINVDFEEEFAKSMIIKVNEMYLKNMLHVYCLNKFKFEQ